VATLLADDELADVLEMAVESKTVDSELASTWRADRALFEIIASPHRACPRNQHSGPSAWRRPCTNAAR
jgi:hypothetical protein